MRYVYCSRDLMSQASGALVGKLYPRTKVTEVEDCEITCSCAGFVSCCFLGFRFSLPQGKAWAEAEYNPQTGASSRRWGARH